MSKPKQDKAPEHEHIWDRWYPQDRNHKHRRCLLPGCGASEIREVEG